MTHGTQILVRPIFSGVSYGILQMVRTLNDILSLANILPQRRHVPRFVEISGLRSRTISDLATQGKSMIPMPMARHILATALSRFSMNPQTQRMKSPPATRPEMVITSGAATLRSCNRPSTCTSSSVQSYYIILTLSHHGQQDVRHRQVHRNLQRNQDRS